MIPRTVRVAIAVLAMALAAAACDVPHPELKTGECVDTGRMIAVTCADSTSDGLIVDIFRTTAPSPVPCPSSTRMVTTSEGNEGPMVLVSICLADDAPPS